MCLKTQVSHQFQMLLCFQKLSNIFSFKLCLHKSALQKKHQCSGGLIVAKYFPYFLQIQLKSSHGETILISAWVMVIRRADSPLSLWTCLPEMEFTLSRYDGNTLWLCQLCRGFSQWLTSSKEPTSVTDENKTHLGFFQ